MKKRSSVALLILVVLASKRFGLTLQEIMDDVGISRRVAYWNIRALEAMGVEITRHKEPVRSSWRTLYRLAAIRGLKFEIRRKA